jgi:hypothetical protein
MKKYPDHLPAIEALRDAPPSGSLEFPAAPDFTSRPPQVDLHTMLRRIEKNMPWRNSRPGEAERRLAEKIPVEFVL